MIIQLNREHHEDVLRLFGDRETEYRFLIEDISEFAYDDGPGRGRVYGEYVDGELRSILLNNFSNLTYYSPEDRDVSVYEDFLEQCQFHKISGPWELVDKLLPYVEVECDASSYLAVVRQLALSRQQPELDIQTVSSELHLGMLYDLLNSTEEYRLGISRDEYVASQLETLRASDRRTLFLCLNGKMVASCATIRETSSSAIIIGVVTHPDYRRRGYGTELLVELCSALLSEGRYPYLFYDNPAARSVYLRLGATEVCEWRVVMVKG